MSPISEAIDSCNRGELGWINPVVLALDARQHGSAIRWLVICVRQLLVRSSSLKAAELLADVDRLERLIDDPPPATKFCEIGHEIWYRPDRDPAQTAVAKLYEAGAAQLNAKDRRYLFFMGAPIDNLIFEFDDRSWNDRAVELRDIVIREFVEMKSALDRMLPTAKSHHVSSKSQSPWLRASRPNRVRNNRMKSIATAWLKGRTTELDAAAIRKEVERIGCLLSAMGIGRVRVWCSYNPDLPDDSPLQSPERIVTTEAVTTFFDQAVRNGVWKYGDSWNRAAIVALDGSFTFFMGNDKDITLETDDERLLQETRSAWRDAGYEVAYESNPSSSRRLMISAITMSRAAYSATLRLPGVVPRARASRVGAWGGRWNPRAELAPCAPAAPDRGQCFLCQGAVAWDAAHRRGCPLRV